MQRLTILSQPVRLPRRWRRRSAIRFGPRVAGAVLDPVKASLRLDHPQPCRAAVKPALLVAPQIGTPAEVFLRTGAAGREVPVNLAGKRVPRRVVDTRRTQPAPLEHVLWVEPTRAQVAVGVLVFSFGALDRPLGQAIHEARLLKSYEYESRSPSALPSPSPSPSSASAAPATASSRRPFWATSACTPGPP